MAKFSVMVPFEVEANDADEAHEKVYLVICQEADPSGATKGVSYRGDLVKVEGR